MSELSLDENKNGEYWYSVVSAVNYGDAVYIEEDDTYIFENQYKIMSNQYF